MRTARSVTMSVRRSSRVNTFGKQLTVLITGSVASQIILFLSAPVIARMFSPTDYGVFTFYSSMISILSMITGGKYEIAIVLPDSDEEAANVMGLSMLSVLAVTGFAAVLFAFFGEWFMGMFGADSDPLWLIWIPIGMLAVGWYQSCNYWSTRKKTFKRQSISQILRSTTVSGIQLSTGFSGIHAVGLILGQLGGQVIATSALMYQTWKEDGKMILSQLRWAKIKAASIRYKQFPLFNMPQTFLNALSNQMAPFLLAMYYGSAVVGFYGVSLRLLQQPITIISQSVRQVYLKRASEVHNKGQRLFPVFMKTTAALFAIGIVPTLIIMIWGPELFKLLLGEKWGLAGEYARWMVLWLFFAYLNPPASVTAQVLERQKSMLVFEVFLFSARWLSLWLGYELGDNMTSIICFSLTGALFQLIYIAGIGAMCFRSRMPQVEIADQYPESRS
ncbi:lipopolysaccharide biosynthesis protein [Paenibacillus sp. R14(2021)]|uniref:lipopolysaccharide biosynthesis protein n=1 Tax=Paenibacillus sp. R14(2021) TaxID=2859228 RepID=UPI001C614284|nr:lipopolysaccharide biosynthesis protein [Paenibacillus sp. R14(2021)]